MERVGSSDGEPKRVFSLDSARNWITRRALELLLLYLEETAKSEFPIWFKAKFAADFKAKSNWKTAEVDMIMQRKPISGVYTGNELKPEVARDVHTGEEVEVKPVDDDDAVEELSNQLAESKPLMDYRRRMVRNHLIAELAGVRHVIAEITQGISSDDLQQLRQIERRIEDMLEAAGSDSALSSHLDVLNFLQHQMQQLLEPSYFSTEGKTIVGLWSDSEKIQRTIKKLLSVSAQINEIPELTDGLNLISYINSSECKSAAIEEEKLFDRYRHMWEVFNSNKFEELTSLSSMIFTHCAPGRMPWYAMVKPTLQIISIKITDLTGIKWPLRIYGIIAARDDVDNRRNPIFLCPRDGWQLVTQQDPFLHLTGPSRSFLCEEPVTIEVQLKLKGRIESEDKLLMSRKLSYNRGSADSFCTLDVANHFCRMEFCCQKVERSVQATIIGVRDVEWPFSFEEGVQVFCSSLPRGYEDGDNSQACPNLLLYDSKHGMKSMDGHLDVPRNVVSADLGGKIKILIKDCALGGIIGHVLFTPKKCNFSQAICHVGAAQVEVTIAWSMLVQDDECIFSSSYIDPFDVCPPLHPSMLSFLKTGVAKESMKT